MATALIRDLKKNDKDIKDQGLLKREREKRQ